MNLHEYLRVLRERWLLVVVCLVLGVVGAGAATSVTPREYTSSAVMYVSAQAASDDPGTAYEGGLLSLQRIKSYAKLLSSQRVTADVVDRLGLDMSPGELVERVSATTDLDTVLLTVTVRDESAERAATIANTVATSFIRLVDELEQPVEGDSLPPVVVRVVEQATPAPVPVSPRLNLNLAVGALLGLLVGLGAAFLRNAVDITVKSVDRIRELTGAPNIGLIGVDPKLGSQPLTMQDDPQSPRAEAFRKLWTNLQFIDVDRQRKVIVVTSATAGEGRTTTTCNLAIMAAAAGSRVLVVDADLRHPTVAEYLGLESAVGMTSVLSGRVSFEDALQPWGGVIDVLTTGPIPPNPSELLSSRLAAGLLEQARKTYDLVLVDTPPLLPVTDASALAPASDGVILVVRLGRTTTSQLKAASDALDGVSASILGTVSCMVPVKGLDGYAQHQTHYRAETLPAREQHDPESTPTAAVAESSPVGPRDADPTSPQSLNGGASVGDELADPRPLPVPDAAAQDDSPEDSPEDSREAAQEAKA